MTEMMDVAVESTTCASRMRATEKTMSSAKEPTMTSGRAGTPSVASTYAL